MVSVYGNWERLVRATLQREQLRSGKQGHERTSSGIVGTVPASLSKTTNIDAILQAADEIQAEDPNVARILCERAYSMSQDLDPSSAGRGVLQFKTGLMSVIKQKFAKRDGSKIDRDHDIERLWEFYQQYKRRHKVDDMQREHQRFRDSGTSNANLGELEEMSLETKRVFATMRALIEVIEAHSKDAPDGVGEQIVEELRRIKKSDGTLTGKVVPYNIVPLDAPTLTNAIGTFAEVKAAISAIRYIEFYPSLPADFKLSGVRNLDIFDLLEYVFGFQKDNIRNQRENVVLSIANAQSRLGIPTEAEPKVDERAITEVFLKALDNYIKWCKYLKIRLAWNSLEAINKDRKVILVSLYYLIWGEAANVRFLPECICYIFHHMAKELDAILDHGEAQPAASCGDENGSVSYLDQIICPIYKTLSAEADENKNGKAAHSAWRNYDDFNEYFWSPTCFELSWPMKKDSSFLLKPKKRKRLPLPSPSFSFTIPQILYAPAINSCCVLSRRSYCGFLPCHKVFKVLRFGILVVEGPVTIDELGDVVFEDEEAFVVVKDLSMMVGEVELGVEANGLFIVAWVGGICCVSALAYWRAVIRAKHVATLARAKHVILVSPFPDSTPHLLSGIPDGGRFLRTLSLIGDSLFVVGVVDGKKQLCRASVISSLVSKFSSTMDVSDHNVPGCLDVMFTFGAYTTARGMAISRLFIRFFWCGISSVFVTYVYLKVLQERNDRNSDSFYFRIYVIVLGVYAGLRISLTFLLKFPACHALSEMSDRWSFFQFFKWIYQERYYVGRGLFESTRDYMRYVLFWLVIFGCKFTFAYFLQARHNALAYAFSSYNSNVLTIASLWAPVFAIYIMDIHIWYTLLSAVIGGIMGARARLGEIRSIEMVHKRFETFPEAFVKNLVSSQTRRAPFERQSSEVQVPQEINKAYAATFSPFWNEIIKSLREEDFISNRERDLLSIPTNTGTLRLVQWPLFLLSSKILMAMDLAFDCKDTQGDLWNRISRDEYMAYAVQECYYSVEKILNSLVDNEGRLWVERVFREINNSVTENSLFMTLSLKKLQLVSSRFTALTGLLLAVIMAEVLFVDGIAFRTRSETPELAKGAAKAVYDLYEVVMNDLLSSDLREQLDTWNILAKARNEGRLFSRIEWPKDLEIKEQIKRLHLLLTVKDSAANIPNNLEARRRLEFFSNSLFMDMPLAKPVSEMIPFSETVLYSSSELRVENEDGISTLFYLQKIFPDEWENFLERIGRGESTEDTDLKDSSRDSLELRFWASYRGQTLARTVRGMMYYRRALMLQSHLERKALRDTNAGYSGPPSTQGFELSREARAQADLKFTYVVSCQIYGQQKQMKKPEATDIALLLQRNEALRVAFIHMEESGVVDGKISKEYYSKLVKADVHGKDQEIFSIKLPGDPKLGEGKPENQNHAIIFTRGEAIQTIDMNQDNYLEEAMKMRNLLEEFRSDHGLRPPTILGVREHVFTGSVSSLALFMSNQETSFVTLGQRVLANPLKVRMHYGHPDVFDRVFHISRGGVNIPVVRSVSLICHDLDLGFNSTLRQGNITHHEYIQVGKGRDVGLNQIALFEGKVAGGNGEQVLSRDIYRLGQLFDFFRMLSFFFTTVGFYVCTMMTVLTVYIFLYGKLYLAFSGLDRGITREAKLLGNTALDAALNAQFLVQIGIFTAVPMIMGFILELGLLKAVFSFITMQFQLCSVFFTFSLGTRTHYFGRTILHGGAKYKATGRGFVVQHIKFAENYRLYSRSHFVKALEVALLLIVYIAYGYTNGGALSYILLTVSSWFLVISWLFAPYIFNPSGFEWQKTVEDFDNWTSWLLYKGGVGVKGEHSWESWWDEEQTHIQTWRGRILETILSLRFFIFQYGVVYKLHLTGKDTSLAIFTFSPKKSTNFELVMRFIQGVTSIALLTALCLVVYFTDLSIPDLFASVLAYIPTGWAILCLAITWKKIVKSLGLWDSVREFARLYDAGMGMIIFAPVAILSWFPFISTFQSRLLFNQAFSRGLEISIILAGNKANVQS
ncbi:hypothetical protein GIB67_004503 [Kingdonia uniflora]|uniref:1,3-beta-glucan synthase n=1 Tax=Kingdonia uniflora TaxID=39325 RepID=A0A7J7MRM3_9MAGN|nr:hypothetical protein GIB67_004503 [Kingdonia uniflora]